MTFLFDVFGFITARHATILLLLRNKCANLKTKLLLAPPELCSVLARLLLNLVRAVVPLVSEGICRDAAILMLHYASCFCKTELLADPANQLRNLGS